jgi:hypothetical protein
MKAYNSAGRGLHAKMVDSLARSKARHVIVLATYDGTPVAYPWAHLTLAMHQSNPESDTSRGCLRPPRNDMSKNCERRIVRFFYFFSQWGSKTARCSSGLVKNWCACSENWGKKRSKEWGERTCSFVVGDYASLPSGESPRLAGVHVGSSCDHILVT